MDLALLSAFRWLRTLLKNPTLCSPCRLIHSERSMPAAAGQAGTAFPVRHSHRRRRRLCQHHPLQICPGVGHFGDGPLVGASDGDRWSSIRSRYPDQLLEDFRKTQGQHRQPAITNKHLREIFEHRNDWVSNYLFSRVSRRFPQARCIVPTKKHHDREQFAEFDDESILTSSTLWILTTTRLSTSSYEPLRKNAAISRSMG